MPPQPEYVLIRDKAQELIDLAQKELENNKPGLVCLLTYIAKILLHKALSLRQDTNELHEILIGANKIVSIVLTKNDRRDAIECLKEIQEFLGEVNRVFMERGEEECECWGE